MTRDFSRHIFEKYSDIKLLWADLFRADGRTDVLIDRHTHMMKLTVAFCDFSNAPKTWMKLGLRLAGR